MWHICLGFASIFLLIQNTHSCVKYVDRSASAAYQDYIEEQEKIRLEELEAEYYEENINEEYYYQEGEGEYEYEDCRVCEPEEYAQYEQEYYEDPAPRFFFQEIQGIFDTTRGLPCCESPIRQTDTTPEPTGPRLKNATRCGRKSYQRIIGGDVTTENEFPWQCALLRPDHSFYGCSAVLLSCDPVILVTAAHCFPEGADPSKVMVACGAHRIDRPDPSPEDRNEIRVNVSEIIIHEDFSWVRAHHPFLGDNDGHPVGIALFENDLAVLKLEDDSDLRCRRKKIWPACLPSMYESYYPNWYKTGLAGWGVTLNNGNLSNTLVKVNAPIVSDKTCQERVCHVSLGPISVQNCIIADNHICAGGMSGKGPCRGDSGGALLAQDRELLGWSAVGIVSYQPGIECGTENYVVFTEIRKYLSWIAAQYGLLPPRE